MGAVQRDHWYLTVLVFLHFLKVTVPQKDAVTVRLEEGMVLECLCPWKGNFSMVSWTKPPKKDPIAIFHPDFGTSFSHHYRERVEFLRGTNMDGSISLRNVTHQDLGLYHCSMQTFPQGSWTKSFQVEDLDEPPKEEEEEEEEEEKDDDYNSSETRDVMVADTEVVAELHGNATIACDGGHNRSVHEVTLERVARGERPRGVIGACRKMGGAPAAQSYGDRGRLGCTDTLGVSLHLTGVQQQDAGLYRCTWSGDGGPQSTTVLLRVQPAGGVSLSAFAMYVYIGAGVAAFVLLVAVVVTVVVAAAHKGRRERAEYRVKLRPSRRPIDNFYENVSLYPRKKPRKVRECPVYVNLLTVHAKPSKEKK